MTERRIDLTTHREFAPGGSRFAGPELGREIRRRHAVKQGDALVVVIPPWAVRLTPSFLAALTGRNTCVRFDGQPADHVAYVQQQWQAYRYPIMPWLRRAVKAVLARWNRHHYRA